MKKRNLEKGELGFAAAMGIFSLICLIGSLKIFLKTPTLSGEGTVPLVTSAVLVLMTILMFVEMKNCPVGFAKGTALGQKFCDLIAFLFPGRVGFVLLYCIAYAILIGFIGFIASTAIFLLASMLTLDKSRPVQKFLITAITLACIVILFQYIFKVQLP